MAVSFDYSKLLLSCWIFSVFSNKYKLLFCYIYKASFLVYFQNISEIGTSGEYSHTHLMINLKLLLAN